MDNNIFIIHSNENLLIDEERIKLKKIAQQDSLYHHRIFFLEDNASWSSLWQNLSSQAIIVVYNDVDSRLSLTDG